jgi:hypothetical protein
VHLDSRRGFTNRLEAGAADQVRRWRDDVSDAGREVAGVLPRIGQHRHSPSISMILAQAYDATMMPIPASRDDFQQCKLPVRADGARLWGRIARGTRSGGGIERATAESEQRT